MFHAKCVWETFPFRDQKKWVSGYDAKKNLVHRILILCGCENDNSVMVRFEHEDEDTWSTRTNLYFDKIGAMLKEKNINSHSDSRNGQETKCKQLHK